MIELTKEPFDALQYLVEHNFDAECLKDVKDNLYLYFDTKNFDFEIDANIAQCLVNYQKLIYETYCIAKYGRKDLRKLTIDEQQKLCLKYKIRKGCTEYFVKLGEVFNTMLESLPPEVRFWVLPTVIVGIWGYIGFSNYFKNQQEKIKQQTLIQEQQNTRLAIEKLASIAETNTLAKKAINNTVELNTKNVEYMEDAQSDVIINGIKYIKSEITEINKEARQRSKIKQLPQSKNIKGRYTVTSIETKSPYRLTLQNKDGKITPTYNPGLLNIEIIRNIQSSMAKSAPVDFDFEINVFTNENGIETMEVINIE